MTIGFTIVAGRKLLLQQVQATSKSGNRWMFKLPANRLEFVIDKLRDAFPGHEILVADGEDYAGVSMGQYEDAYEIVSKRDNFDNDDREHLEYLSRKIAQLEQDMPRIAAFYRNTGRYQLGAEVKIADLKHYKLAA